MAQQRSDQDKQSSKNKSRPVATKNKSGQAKPGAGPRKSAPTKAGGRSTSTIVTYGLIGLVVIIIAVLVLVKVTGSSTSASSGGSTGGSTLAPQSLVDQVTKIPASVYDKVGITSSATPVTPPTAIHGQTPLTYPNSAGKDVPGVFYFGAEYCPFCAAERWAVIAALSRFGTFSGLGITESSTSDVYAGTPTFSFYKATLSSDTVALKAIERYSNVPDANGYTPLMTPTSAELAMLNKYDTSKFITSMSASDDGSIPFISIGNQFLVSGASYSPAILSGLTRDEIASGLSDPSNPATQAIIATANYLTASICHTTGGQPGDVCTSKGVQEAAKAMGISAS